MKRNSNFYFNATFIGRFLVVRIISSYDSISAYLAGLLLTIFVMHVYKHAQPALLYLVPACLGRTPAELLAYHLALLGVPLFLALVRGDIKSMFQYEDHPNVEEKKTN